MKTPPSCQRVPQVVFLATLFAIFLPPELSTAQTELLDLTKIESKVASLAPQLKSCVVSVEGGSGFLVSPDGVIATVAHVSKRAGRRVKVRFQDGSTVPGITLGSNKNNDTGGIRLLDKGPWPYLEVSDDSKPMAGDWCLALGYPLGFQDTPCALRIGKIKSLEADRIVTDCAIMGGDSGGPLVDLNGKLIGIHSGATTDLTTNVHLPMIRFRKDASTILASQDITGNAPSTIRKSPFFGVLGETDGTRVRIRKVISGSPADLSGLRANDVLLSLGDQPVESFAEFLKAINARRADERVKATVNRYGQILTVTVTLEQAK